MVRFFGFGGVTLEVTTAVAALADKQATESAAVFAIAVAGFLAALWSTVRFLDSVPPAQWETAPVFDEPNGDHCSE